MKVLILRSDHLGDNILTIPLVLTLVESGYEVFVLCLEKWLSVWENLPNTTAIPLSEASNNYFQDVKNWTSQICCLQPDILFVTEKKWKLLLASFFSNVPHRYCTTCGLPGLLTFHRCLRSKLKSNPRHMTDVWLDLARALHIPEKNLINKPQLFLSESEILVGEQLWQSHFPSSNRIRVIIHPFHGGSSCHPKLEIYLQTAKEIQNTADVLITGLMEELSLIQSQIPVNSHLQMLKEPLTLRQLFALVARADLLICGSTGILQISSALNVPSISLFCAHPYVNSILWGSFAEKAYVLSPSKEWCLSHRNNSNSNCQMIKGPSANNIIEVYLKFLKLKKYG